MDIVSIQKLLSNQAKESMLELISHLAHWFLTLFCFQVLNSARTTSIHGVIGTPHPIEQKALLTLLGSTDLYFNNDFLSSLCIVNELKMICGTGEDGGWGYGSPGQRGTRNIPSTLSWRGLKAETMLSCWWTPPVNQLEWQNRGRASPAGDADQWWPLKICFWNVFVLTWVNKPHALVA